jgi:hypothetical protein
VAFAFLVVMAFSAVPRPLYGPYRARDHFSLDGGHNDLDSERRAVQ